MATENSLPKITKDEIDFFLNGFREFHPEIFDSDVENTIYIAKEYKGYDRKTFTDKFTEATGIDISNPSNILPAVQTLIGWRTYYVDEEARIPKGESQTLPSDLEGKIESLDRTTTERSKTDTAKLNVGQAIATQQKQQTERVSKSATLLETEPIITQPELDTQKPRVHTQATLESPTTKLKPTPEVFLKYEGKTKDEKLNPDELKKLKVLTLAAHESPREFEENIKRRMLEVLPEDIKKEIPPEKYDTVATVIAKDFTLKLLEVDPEKPESYNPKIDPAIEVFQNLANTNREDFKKIIPDEKQRITIAAIAQAGILRITTDSDMASGFLVNALGGDINLVRRFYSSDSKGKWSITDKKEEADVVFSPRTAMGYFPQTAKMVSTFQRIVDPELLEQVGREKVNELANKMIYIKAGEAMASGTKSDFLEILNNPSYELVTDYRTISQVNSIVERWAKNNVQQYQINPLGVISKVTDISLLTMQEGHFVLPVISAGVPYLNASVTIINDSRFAIEFAGQIGRKTFAYTLGKVAAKEGVKKAAGAVAVKAGTTAAAETGAKVVGSAATEAVIPGAGIAAVLTLLYSARHWIKRNFSKILVAGAGVTTLAGVTLAAPVLIVVGGGLTVTYTVIRAGGFVPFFSQVSTTLTRFILGTTESVSYTLAYIMIATPIALTLTVAFMTLVINNSAYVVPPPSSMFKDKGENPDIDVIKIASPAGPFENTVLDPGQEITFTITIIAKKGRLSNIKFSETCTVLQEGTPPKCPDTDPAIPADIPDEVLPGAPFTFTYKRMFDKKFEDSAVTDIFTVTADTPDKQGVSSSGSATVIFGEPPLGCFKPVGDWDPEPLAGLQSAITHLLSDHQAYVAKVCAGGEVTLGYSPLNCGLGYKPGWETGCYWGVHEHGAIDIVFFPNGLTQGETTAVYILTHEASHHLSKVNAGLYQNYINYQGILDEIPICSYPATNDKGQYLASEAFAEAAALYASQKAFICFGGSFQSKYPNHYQFENNIIFK